MSLSWTSRVRLARIAVVVPLAIAYELLARWVLDPFTYVPLSTALGHAADLLGTSSYWTSDLLPTIGQAVAALAAGSLLGASLGIALWRWRTIDRALQPWLLLVYAVPIFALYPVFIALLHPGSLPVIAVACLGVVPAVAVNTAIGLRHTRSVLGNVGRSLGLSQRKLVLRIYLPSAWPYVFSGVKLAASYAVVIVIGTQFILSTYGLGHRIAEAYNNFDLEAMYASISVALMLSILIVVALGALERRLYHGAQQR
jgi:NitT/TauT family transport system permease protein